MPILSAEVHTSADSQERVSVSPLMLPKAPFRCKAYATSQLVRSARDLGTALVKAALPLRSKVIAQRKKRQRSTLQLSSLSFGILNGSEGSAQPMLVLSISEE